MNIEQSIKDAFTVPYSLEGSRHDRVLEQLIEREVEERSVLDQTDTVFAGAEDYKEVFNGIVAGEGYGRPVLVSEFYLFDPDVDWRDETAIELDLARFDPEQKTVYCIETTGKNIAGLSGPVREKKSRVRDAAIEKGRDTFERLAEYMNRHGWTVDGDIAAFYQEGIRGRTEVEIISYQPEEDK